MILDIIRKDGTSEHIENVTYFDTRELEDMVDGEFAVTGSGLYYETESDEIGNGVLIDMELILSYELKEKADKNINELEEPEL